MASKLGIHTYLLIRKSIKRGSALECTLEDGKAILNGKEKKVAIKACGYRGYLHVTYKNVVFIATSFQAHGPCTLAME